jgi:hypothetical protein
MIAASRVCRLAWSRSAQVSLPALGHPLVGLIHQGLGIHYPKQGLHREQGQPAARRQGLGLFKAAHPLGRAGNAPELLQELWPTKQQFGAGALLQDGGVAQSLLA